MSTAEPFSSANPSAIARRVVGIFFPLRPTLKLGTHSYSPTVLHQILAVTAEVKSHGKASKLLKIASKLDISGRHVNRLAEEIGLEMAAKRDQEMENYIHHRREEPTVSAPEVVAVFMDGGRVNTRTPGNGPGVHGQGWKEDKVACLLAFKGEAFESDPHPEPPKCFLDAPKVDKLVREMQAHHGKRQENELPQLAELGLDPPTKSNANSSEPSEDDVQEPEDSKNAWPPKRTKESRTCVATMQDSDAFGKLVAAEAYRRNFQSAAKGAFLGDGSAWIWTQHGKWFSWLTPITDFVHPLTYLYMVATVCSSNVTERWQRYVLWMTLLWQGAVEQVIAEMRAELSAREPVPEGSKLPPTDPRELLRRTIGYLENNKERMNYPEYRKAGLPVTSTMVESLIKEFNYRVKGTEKFFDQPDGAEAILQLRGAVLSDDARLEKFLQTRPVSPFRPCRRRKINSTRQAA